jgi:hypothetical protein
VRRAVAQSSAPSGAQNDEPRPSLDFATPPLPAEKRWEVAGESLGRGLLWIALGSVLLAFGSERYRLPAFLCLIPVGLLLAALGFGANYVVRTGLPLRGVRRLLTVLGVSVLPVGFVWLATPVQRWAGISPAVWQSVAVSAVIVLAVIWFVGFVNRKMAVLRVSAPAADDQTVLRWHDARVAYFRRLVGSRWLWPLRDVTVERALGHALMARFNCPAIILTSTCPWPSVSFRSAPLASSGPWHAFTTTWHGSWSRGSTTSGQPGRATRGLR